MIDGDCSNERNGGRTPPRFRVVSARPLTPAQRAYLEGLVEAVEQEHGAELERMAVDSVLYGAPRKAGTP